MGDGLGAGAVVANAFPADCLRLLHAVRGEDAAVHVRELRRLHRPARGQDGAVHVPLLQLAHLRRLLHRLRRRLLAVVLAGDGVRHQQGDRAPDKRAGHHCHGGDAGADRLPQPLLAVDAGE